MRSHPRLLRAESRSLTLVDTSDWSTSQLPSAYRHVPHWWQAVEDKLRLDLWLALLAKKNEGQADIVWAGSEKVGIPLSFLSLRKPLVVIAHNMGSPIKARFARMTGVVNRWDGIGFISDEAAAFFSQYFQAPKSRLFQYESANYLDVAESKPPSFDGPIFSVGTAHRDYLTLLRAIRESPGYELDILASSRFGDRLRSTLQKQVPPRVRLLPWMTEVQLVQKYQRTRFAAVPLQRTTHTGAGINAVLEAGAFSKAVIATDTGGMRTFVRDGETGILVPPYDVQAWRDAIQMLATDARLCKVMGAAAHRYVEERFDPRTVNANIQQFLLRLWRQEK
jgi:glycosyltransferase involved in cell wall biosynthesis